MRILAAITLAVLCLGCSGTQDARDEAPAPTPGDEPTSFVNKVWKVSQSAAVAPGQLYVFLSDGTLVIASSTGKPSLGTWSYTDSVLTMVEEGISYRVDILKLTPDEFSIRSHNPGEPVDIMLVPADQTLPQ